MMNAMFGLSSEPLRSSNLLIIDYIWSFSGTIWHCCINLAMFVHQIRANFLALMSFVFASSTAQSNSCVTNVAAQSIPSTTSGVALQSFSYCGGLLDVSAYIEVRLKRYHSVHFLLF